jgi:hypothetical protein
MNKEKSVPIRVNPCPNICLAAVLILAVAFRVGIALYYGNIVDAPSLLTDQRSYHGLGARIVQGHGYTFPNGWYPFTPPDTPTAHWSFLYPLFVAAVYALFGVHPLAARLAQAVLGGLLLPWMVYRLSATLFGGRERDPQARSSPVPLLAALWAAAYPYFAMYSATIMTETFYIAVLLWSLDVSLRMARALRRGGPVPWRLTLQLGLSLGIAAVLRQSILPWAPVLFLWLVITAVQGQGMRTVTSFRLSRFKVRSLVPLVVAGLILVGCILPWTVRNYVVYDRFLLLNSNTGYAMYSAQHPMHGTRFREFDAAPLPKGLVRGNEAEMDKALLRLGIGFVLEEPGRYLRLSLSRVRAYFEFWPTPGTTLMHNAGRVASYGVALPFIVYGLAIAIRRAWVVRSLRSEAEGPTLDHKAPARGSAQLRTSDLRLATFPSDLALILLFVTFYSVLHILTWAMVRYRLPVDAVTLPFAALALHDIYARITGVLNTRVRSSRGAHKAA